MLPFHLRTCVLLCGVVVQLVSGASLPAIRDTASGALALAPRYHSVDAEAGDLGRRGNNQPKKKRSCKTRITEEITSYQVIQGAQNQMSDMECGGGTIINSFSRTFQQGFATTFGVFHPTKYLLSAVEKIVPSGQYSQSSGTVTTTGYTSTCDPGAACIQYFQPYMTVSQTRTYSVSVADDGSLCSSDVANAATGESTNPMTNVNCGGNSCDAAGVWGVCYMFDFGGSQICQTADSATLPGSACPSNFAPSPNGLTKNT